MKEPVAPSQTTTHGCAEDPAAFLFDLKMRGGSWTPMAAARLVIGSPADMIRADMGEQWLVVVMAAHLAAAREAGEWSFGHETLRLWLDHRDGRVDEYDYRDQLAQIAADAMRQNCPMM